MIIDKPFINSIVNHDNFMISAMLIFFLLLLYLVRIQNARKSNLTIKSFWNVFGIKMTNISTQLLSAEVISHLESNNEKIKTICLADSYLINKAYTSKPLHYLLNSTDITVPAGFRTSIAAKLNGSNGSHHRSIDKIFFLIARIIFKFSNNTCLITTNKSHMDFIVTSFLNKNDSKKLHTLDISDNYNFDILKSYISRNHISSIITASLDADTIIEIRKIAADNNIKLMLSAGSPYDLIQKKNPLISFIRIVTYTSRLLKHWFFSLIEPSTVESREYLNPAGLTNSFTYGDVYKETFISKLSRKQWHSKVLFKYYLKRSFDIFVSALALLFLGPLLLFTALAIRVESAGPIFFKQVRVGYKGKAFTMYKFRSMFIDAEERLAGIQKDNESGGGVLFKMKKDPRITRIGRIIRKLSIDELPQIINVFRGDMSIVGPRPALPSEVSQYEIQDRKRLQTKPGLTCLWQIGGRSDLTFEQQIELDVKYLAKKSLAEDIAIVVKTVPAVLTGRGAY